MLEHACSVSFSETFLSVFCSLHLSTMFPVEQRKLHGLIQALTLYVVLLVLILQAEFCLP